MKKLHLFAAAAGLTLVGAAPPPSSWDAGEGTASGGYPPCSRTVTDRCIQLYERGVRTPQNLALNERLGPGRIATAMGGPYEPTSTPEDGDWQTEPTVSDYPPCSATVTDRCIQRQSRRWRRAR